MSLKEEGTYLATMNLAKRLLAQGLYSKRISPVQGADGREIQTEDKYNIYRIIGLLLCTFRVIYIHKKRGNTPKKERYTK